MTDRRYIERLFKENYQRLYSLAFAMLKEDQAAHDAVHDVFADLLHSGAYVDKGTGYLIRCVRNRCLNLIKDMPVRESIERLIMTEEGVGRFFGEDDCEETLVKVRSIISDQLPTQCSRVMKLRYEEGLSYEEIGIQLGISKVAVYKHLKNGISQIRKIINPPPSQP